LFNHDEGASQVIRLSADQDVVRQFKWEMVAINAKLNEIRLNWARKLNMRSPQWMILMALADMDQGEGYRSRTLQRYFTSKQYGTFERRAHHLRKSYDARTPSFQAALTEW
jgi:MarR family transcriptional regulator, organic hydroperoxide resistance regulator